MTSKKMTAKEMTAKKKCCRDKPRCQKCPVTLKRLVEAGFAEPQGGRMFLIAPSIPRKVIAAARAR